jgi:hypothetical protein
MDRYAIDFHNEQWRFRKTGSDRAIANSDTKTEALDKMRDFMQAHQGSVVIRKQNGQFQTEHTYPRTIDPPQSPG